MIDYIVIHCSDSPQGRGDDAATIHRWHREKQWSGIGYHYVITEDGTVQNGRPEYWMGAHVKGHNKDTLGICLIGVDYFTDDQFAALRPLLAKLKIRHPEVEVVGHSTLDPGRGCPNFDVQSFLHHPELFEGRGQ